MELSTLLDQDSRPWGEWRVVDVAAGYQVKRITVIPGQRLSLQSHRHRAEHWIVVAGEATCEVEGQVVLARAGESVDVPVGALHRLSNASDRPLVVVEVQRGDYLGEDDIVRHEDDYGRRTAPLP